MTNVITFGSGAPLLLIPGIQGRWEWMRPAVEALARRCRVSTFSLPEGPMRRCDPDVAFDELVEVVDAAIDRAGVQRAALCGVSFGGHIAVRYAAVRPERVSALILVSTPPPGFKLRGRTRYYARWPRLCTPLFVAGSVSRLAPEILSAFETRGQALRFAVRHLWRVALAPMSPTAMSLRWKIAAAVDSEPFCTRVTAPTLVVVGEDGLDRVVPPSETRVYLRLIAGARSAVIEKTGHIGLVTRPEHFAEIVSRFVDVEHRTATVDRETRNLERPA